MTSKQEPGVRGGLEECRVEKLVGELIPIR